MKKNATKAIVQIRLSGEDAELYNKVLNKRAFLIAALRMFHHDEKLRHAFFDERSIPPSDETLTAKETPPSASVQTLSDPQKNAKNNDLEKPAGKKGW